MGACQRCHVDTFCPAVLNALVDGLEEDTHEKDDAAGTAKEALRGAFFVKLTTDFSLSIFVS